MQKVLSFGKEFELIYEIHLEMRTKESRAIGDPLYDTSKTRTLFDINNKIFLYPRINVNDKAWESSVQSDSLYC